MYFVNEDCTSKLCNGCKKPLEPMYTGKPKCAIHAVRRCTNSACLCMVWHRDVNACLSIMYVFKEERVYGRGRPEVFTRTFQRRHPPPT